MEGLTNYYKSIYFVEILCYTLLVISYWTLSSVGRAGDS